MHRASAVSATQSSVRDSSNGESTLFNSLQDSSRMDSSECMASSPPSSVAASRSKDGSPRSRRAMEVLDPTETDVTETTASMRCEEIVEQTNCLAPSPSPQLLIEDMIHRLREVNGNDLEAFIVHPTFVAEPKVNCTTIGKMASRLRRANLSLNERISRRLFGNKGCTEHDRSDSVASRNPCCEPTVRTVDKDPTVEYSLYPDRIKSSIEVAVGDHTSQIPFSELIDRLHRFNKEITTEPKLHVALQRKSKISITQSDDDLDRILEQVSCLCAVAEEIDESDCDVRKPSPVALRSLDRESHQSIMEYLTVSSNNSSWIEEECGTATSEDYVAFAAQGKYSSGFGNICSHLADDDDNDSWCTLHASALSCESSVTWYEGSDIDEILLDDDNVSASIDIGSVDENSFTT